MQPCKFDVSRNPFQDKNCYFMQRRLEKPILRSKARGQLTPEPVFTDCRSCTSAADILWIQVLIQSVVTWTFVEKTPKNADYILTSGVQEAIIDNNKGE